MFYRRLIPRSTGQGQGAEVPREACRTTLGLVQDPELTQDAVVDLRWQTFENPRRARVGEMLGLGHRRVMRAEGPTRRV